MATSYLDGLRQSFSEQIDNLELSESGKARKISFLKERWLDQTMWFEKRATTTQSRYRRLRLSIIIGGLIVPVLLGLDLGDNNNEIRNRVVMGLSLSIASCVAVEEFFNFGEKSLNYRKAAEGMKGEWWKFQTLTGKYSKFPSIDTAIPAFAQRVEQIIESDLQNFTEMMDEQLAEGRKENQKAFDDTQKAIEDLNLNLKHQLEAINQRFDSANNSNGQTPDITLENPQSQRKEKYPELRTITVIPSDDLEIAHPNTFIKATTKTYLKKQPINSSELLDEQKVLVPVGQEYKVLKHSKISKHSEATLEVKPQSSQIPQSGIKLIKEFEGYEKELPDGRAQAYPDPAHGWGVPTIGYGTTKYPDGSSVKQGQIITKTKAEEYLIHYVDKKCRPALENIPTWRQMNDNQRGAIYSFAYNLGEGFYGGSNFESITRVCDSPKRWNNKQWVEEQFVKYSKAGNKTLPGLVRRRKAEAKLFCTPPSTAKVKVNKVPKYSGETNGHCIVELDYDQEIWYIWQDHWDLPWNQNSKNNISTEKKSAPKYNKPDAVQRQIDRLTKYLPASKTLNLDVKTKYFSQRDNYRDAGRTCNSSSNAMYLDWLCRVIGKPGLDGDNGYLRKVFSIGDSPQHWVQTKAINAYGFRTKWMTDKDTLFIKDLVKAGFPVVVNILHKGSIRNPSGGHIIMLIDRKEEDWIAHDPWGTLKSHYQVHKGEYSRISEKEFNARWQGGYRTLA